MTGRMEIVGRVSGRRRWPDAEKLEILAEAFQPGVRVCDVIARHEVSSSLIYTWRKQLREGKLAGATPSLPVFAEVQLAEPFVPTSPTMPCASGRIEQLELALEELEAERHAAPVEKRPSEATARPAPVRSLPAHLPREDVVHEPASGACSCPDCGDTLRRLGMDAHEMLNVLPVR